jgi:hypothetical protein
MPNPPITVGELTDVPAPESPINAQFHQEVANRIVHRFASVGAMTGSNLVNGSVATVGTALYFRQAGLWVVIPSSDELAAVDAKVALAPLGILGRANGGQHIGITGLTELARINWAADPSRWYRTTALVPALYQNASTGPFQANITIRDPLNNVMCNGVVTLGVGSYAPVALSLIESGLTLGTAERRLKVESQVGGSLNVTVGSGFTAPYIAVEDLGAV